MKKFFSIKNILILTGAGLFIGLLLFLFADAFINRNFRTTLDKISLSEQVDLKGLRDIKASGGAAVHFLDLKRRLSHIKEKKLLVDGMTEFHGYLMGIPTTFLAYQARHRFSWKYKVRRFLLTGTQQVCRERVVPEEEEAIKNGFSYIYLNAGSRFIPAPEKIDEMVSILESIPDTTWVHFHCHHGKGRTSIMLAMLDIMKNAPTVSLKDIITRQHLLGSEDLLDTTVWARGTYTKEQLEQRRDFITQFYEFICQRKAGGPRLWSEWQKVNNGMN
ncbi:MAG: hypothetical protein H0X26_00540 [Alphaproteobacteria bacterium]|nr:hypothetical protein [Alphaproteobacteria bacterium]